MDWKEVECLGAVDYRNGPQITLYKSEGHFMLSVAANAFKGTAHKAFLEVKKGVKLQSVLEAIGDNDLSRLDLSYMEE